MLFPRHTPSALLHSANPQTSNIGLHTYLTCWSLPLDSKLLVGRNCFSFIYLQCPIKCIVSRSLLSKVPRVTLLPFSVYCYLFSCPQMNFLSSASSCPRVYSSSTLCRRSCPASSARTRGWWSQLSDPSVWSLYTEWVLRSASSYRIPDFPKRGSSMQPADRSLVPGKGSPLTDSWVLLVFKSQGL